VDSTWAWARAVADRGAAIERDDDEAWAREELAGVDAAGRVAATVGGGGAAVVLGGGGAAVILGGGGAGAVATATALCTSCTLRTVISSGRSGPDPTCIPRLGATGVDALRIDERQAMTPTTRTIVTPKLPSTTRCRASVASALSSTRCKPGFDEAGVPSSCCSRIVLGVIAPFPLTDGDTLYGYD